MKKSPTIISATYFVLGVLWIFFSDAFLQIFFTEISPQELTGLQIVKGSLFVIVTSLLLYFVISTLHRKLSHSAKQYKELFNQSATPMWIFDAKDYKVIEVNRAALTIYGYHKKELIAKSIKMLWEEKDWNVFINKVPIAKTGDIKEAIQRHRNKEGKQLLVQVQCHEMIFHDRACVLMYIREGTELAVNQEYLIDENEQLTGLVNTKEIELDEAKIKLEKFNRKLQNSNKVLIKALQKNKDQAQVIERQSKETLNRVLSSINDVVWSIDLMQQRFIYLSPSAEKIYGIPFDEIFKRGDFDDEMVFEEDRLIKAASRKELFNIGESASIYRINKKVGGTVWLYEHVILTKNEFGNPVRLDGVASDMTNIKEAEKEIQENALRTATILDSVTDAFFALNSNWQLVGINKKFEELLNAEREKLIGKNIWEVFTDAKHHQIYAQYHQAMDNKVTVSFQEFYEPLQAWLDMHVYPMEDGIAVYFKDITEQKNNQLKIYQSEQNLNALINSVSDVMWSLDMDFSLISFNKAFSDSIFHLIGERPFIGQKVTDKTKFSDEIIAKWVALYRKVLKEGELIFEDEFILDGQQVYNEVTIKPMHDRDGQVFGLSCYSKDITAAKQFDIERSKLIERLISQNKSLEEFAFMTSHSLRGPLASIMGILSIFDRKALDSQLENMRLLGYMDQEVAKLNGVIEDIARGLDIRGQLHEVKENVELEALIAQIQLSLQQQLTAVGGTIKLNLIGVKKIYTIRKYLLNILSHLIGNAIKYRHSSRTPEILVEVSMSNAHYKITVADNGIGFNDKEIGGEVFKLYKRFHFHTEGRGLGLYLVKIQVEALNGKITVKSEEGVGSEFSIYLEKNERKLDEQSPRIKAETPHGSTF